jgi:predicted Zn-dependent protease
VDPRLEDITKPLQNLSASDQTIVDDAIRAIDRKEHVVALAILSKLSASNPMNTSLRVLRAYVLLEVGNVAGALTEARTAESTGTHSAYRCWFLAQVASAAGNKQLCRREVRHLAGSSYEAEARQLPVLNRKK